MEIGDQIFRNVLKSGRRMNIQPKETETNQNTRRVSRRGIEQREPRPIRESEPDDELGENNAIIWIQRRGGVHRKELSTDDRRISMIQNIQSLRDEQSIKTDEIRDESKPRTTISMVKSHVPDGHPDDTNMEKTRRNVRRVLDDRRRRKKETKEP